MRHGNEQAVVATLDELGDLLILCVHELTELCNALHRCAID